MYPRRVKLTYLFRYYIWVDQMAKCIKINPAKNALDFSTPFFRYTFFYSLYYFY